MLKSSLRRFLEVESIEVVMELKPSALGPIYVVLRLHKSRYMFQVGLSGVDERGNVEEKLQEKAPWESLVSPMVPEKPSLRGPTADSTTEDTAADSGEEDSRDQQQLHKPAPRKRSSWSRAHNPSSDDSATCSGESSRYGREETWKVEQLDNDSFSDYSSRHHGSDHNSGHHSRSSRQYSYNSQSDHSFSTGRGHKEADGGSHSYDSRSS